MKKKRTNRRPILTVPERKAKKRAEQDLERFKKRLRLMVGRTKLVWNGKPYSSQSTYDFQIHSELIKFFLALFSSHQERQADQETLEAAQAVADLNKKEFTESGPKGNIEDMEGRS
jgi:hypothetical protein